MRELRPHTQSELEELRDKIAKIKYSDLYSKLAEAYKKCDPANGFPESRDMQELIQVWKALWKWRGGRR